MIIGWRLSSRKLVRHESWMTTQRLFGTSVSNILERVRDGTLSVQDAQTQLRSSAPDTLLESFANLDHTRAVRTGFPEVVFAEGKTPAQVAAILDDMARHVNQSSDNVTSNAILATRVTQQQYKEIAKIPLQQGTIQYHETARIVSMQASSLQLSQQQQQQQQQQHDKNIVVVVTAGTTDLPVAEEAAVVLEASGGVHVERIYDCGVAGLHRILRALPRIQDPRVQCVIVCAGMDGALPSVVGGLVQVPVIAAPTSIGYGASFGGVSALLTMLNSCAPGVGVVNIDNGFGAAALAYKIVRGQS